MSNNIQPQIPPDNQIYDFLKYVMSEVLSKITVVTSTINDVTTQVRTLIILDGTPPSRSDLLEKTNHILDILRTDLDTLQKDINTQAQQHYDKLLNKIEDKDKEQSRINELAHDNNQKLISIISKLEQTSTEVHDNNQKLIDIIPKVEQTHTEVHKMNSMFIFTIKASKISFVVVPVLWVLYRILDRIILNLSK